MRIIIKSTKQELAKAFSEWLVSFLKSAKKEMHVALSGGSTPKMIFKELAAEYQDKVDWSKVHFYWGDERCVPPTDSDSNYGMTAELLLSRISIPPENIHRIKGENDPKVEARSYGSLLKEKLSEKDAIPSFDLVILGMGDDGHTASIFPHQISLWEAEEYCLVADHPETGQKRISLSGKIINNAGTVAFLVAGIGKSTKVREIIKSEGEYRSYPATLVAPESGNLFWFLDKDAASEL